MLVLSRKVDETIEIRPREGAGAETLADVFAQGGIKIRVVRISSSRVQVAIEAPYELEIRRGAAAGADELHDADSPTACTRYVLNLMSSLASQRSP